MMKNREDSRAEMITNADVIKRVRESKTIVDTKARRNKNWVGHVMSGNGLLREVMESKMLVKRGLRWSHI